MAARKWRTDRRTEGPRAGRRYWVTVNDSFEHYVVSASFDGMAWFNVCGLRNGFEADSLPRIALAWSAKPEAPEPWQPEESEAQQ